MGQAERAARAQAEVVMRRETIELAREWFEAHADRAGPGDVESLSLKFLGLLVVECDRRDAELRELHELVEHPRRR